MFLRFHYYYCSVTEMIWNGNRRSQCMSALTVLDVDIDHNDFDKYDKTKTSHHGPENTQNTWSKSPTEQAEEERKADGF